MRLYPSLIVAALVFGTSNALSLDMAHVSCRIFATASDDDIGVVLMWLRGYHAGKTGSIAATDIAELQAYGLNLGRYCKDHTDDLIVNASEKILAGEHQDTPDNQKGPMSVANPEIGSEAAGQPGERVHASMSVGSTNSASRKIVMRHARHASTASHRSRRRHARRSS